MERLSASLFAVRLGFGGLFAQTSESAGFSTLVDEPKKNIQAR